MLFKAKRNPIFELQKKLEKERILLGNLDDNGQFETDDKIMYSIIEKIFNTGKEEIKSTNKTSKIFYSFWGFMGTALIVMILFLSKIIKI